MKHPKKFHLDKKLCDLIDDLSSHYEISKSDLVEELIHAALFPEGFSTLQLIQSDDFYKSRLQQYAPKIN